MENKIDKEKYWLELIVDYLAGRASEERGSELMLWISESEDNKQYYDHVKEVYDSLEILKAKSQFDKDRAYNLFIQRVREEQRKQESIPVQISNTESPEQYGTRYSRKTLLWIVTTAASLALILGLSIPYFTKNTVTSYPSKVLVESPRGEKSKIYLPDGTLVWLNSGSQLAYYTDFNSGNRKVLLEGEAFFDVSENKELPFDVYAGNLKIQVLGTSFNVNSYGEERNTVVSLLEGQVAVMTAQDEKLLSKIHPQQKIVVDKTTGKYELLSCDADMDGIWRYGQLKINNDPMSQVIAKMERWYGVNINLEGKQRSERYWLTIKTESLTEILELINKITPIGYQIKGEEVIIRYK
ncbi:MAG: FecR family protein [Dysgonomonas sp.]